MWMQGNTLARVASRKRRATACGGPPFNNSPVVRSVRAGNFDRCDFFARTAFHKTFLLLLFGDLPFDAQQLALIDFDHLRNDFIVSTDKRQRQPTRRLCLGKGRDLARRGLDGHGPRDNRAVAIFVGRLVDGDEPDIGLDQLGDVALADPAGPVDIDLVAGTQETGNARRDVGADRECAHAR